MSQKKALSRPFAGGGGVARSCRATGGVAATASRVALHCDTFGSSEGKFRGKLLESVSRIARCWETHFITTTGADASGAQYQ